MSNDYNGFLDLVPLADVSASTFAVDVSYPRFLRRCSCLNLSRQPRRGLSHTCARWRPLILLSGSPHRLTVCTPSKASPGREPRTSRRNAKLKFLGVTFSICQSQHSLPCITIFTIYKNLHTVTITTKSCRVSVAQQDNFVVIIAFLSLSSHFPAIRVLAQLHAIFHLDYAEGVPYSPYKIYNVFLTHAGVKSPYMSSTVKIARSLPYLRTSPAIFPKTAVSGIAPAAAAVLRPDLDIITKPCAIAEAFHSI